MAVNRKYNTKSASPMGSSKPATTPCSLCHQIKYISSVCDGGKRIFSGGSEHQGPKTRDSTISTPATTAPPILRVHHRWHSDSSHFADRQPLRHKRKQDTRAQKAKQVEERRTRVHPLLFLGAEQGKDPADTVDNHRYTQSTRDVNLRTTLGYMQAIRTGGETGVSSRTRANWAVRGGPTTLGHPKRRSPNNDDRYRVHVGRILH